MPDKCLILVVEDDPILQIVVKKSIEHLGYKCEVVACGEDAVKRDQRDIALIFMDMRLPGIQGGEAALRIREKQSEEQRERVPIIALSGNAVKAECMRAGMDDFLEKPALMSDYQRMIDKWVPSLAKADELPKPFL